jgi:hypothetical protein
LPLTRSVAIAHEVSFARHTRIRSVPALLQSASQA